MAEIINIAPELLDKIRSSFERNIKSNPKIAAIYELIQADKATYIQAEDYAYYIGEALADAFAEHLTAAALPNGKMYYNIAERVIRPLLEEDHQMVSDAAALVQTSLNKKAGIGIEAQRAPVNEDRIKGIIDRLADDDNYDNINWILDEPVKNFSQAVVDETLSLNVEFHGKSGLRPIVVRKSERKCCQWCQNLAGKYAYPDVPDDVYRRHENCRCTVDYDPGTGQRQNVHTKQWS